MSPPGRRRHNAPHLFLLFALCSFLLIQSSYAASAVLGLDVGTEYIKAALVKPGVPLDIVLTKDSKRKQAAAIGFKPSALSAQDDTQLPERLYGGDALAVAPRFSSDVYPNLKPLLGAIVDTQAAVDTYKSRFPGLQLGQTEDGAHTIFKTLGKAQEAFTVEELLAMEMIEMKQNAETMAGKGFAVRNAVITVPPFYTVDERRAIALAAELAGLEVMSLISDGLAVGLNYATSRKFPNVDKGEKPEHHLVYDMGAGSTTASVLKFQARTVKDVGRFNKTIQEVNVIGTGWDRTLGGDYLNEIILDDMIKKFVETKQAKAQSIEAASIQRHGRTMAKLWREAERLRQVLSANTGTSANMESLYEDIDFKYKLSRTDFEALVSNYIARVTSPIQDALQGAKLGLEDLDSIVLHGGTVRTPFVQKELENLVGNAAKLRTNVNADEAAVFGAAFRAAGLSPSFKVKDIKSNDAANYVAMLKWTTNGKPRSQKVFVPTSQAGTVKQIPFNVSEDFSLSFSQLVGEDNQERKIGDFKVANLTASIAELVSKHGCVTEDVKTVVSTRLDPVSGLPEVSGGSVSCEVDELEKKGGVVDGVKGLFGFGGKKEQDVLGDESDPTESTETLSESPSLSSTASRAESNSTSSTSIATPSAKTPKKRIESINLAIEPQRTDLRQPTLEQLDGMRQVLQAYDKSDKARRSREESFNTLESYTYRARDYLAEEGFIGVSTGEQRKAVEDLISSTSEWLHEDGTSAAMETIKEKYKSLKSLIDPIRKRQDEQQKRPQAIESLQSTLNQSEIFLKSMREQIDQAADAAASASSSTTESSSPTPIPLDDLEDLDDEPASSSTPSTPTPSITSPFSEDDYEEFGSSYEKARDWLVEQLAAQDTLSPSDDPVVTSSEVNAKSKQLNEALSRVLMKHLKFENPPKSSSSSKSKGKKSTKGKSTSSSSKKSSATSSATASSASEAHSEL